MKQSEIIQKLSKLPEDMLQSAPDYIDFSLQNAKRMLILQQVKSEILVRISI